MFKTLFSSIKNFLGQNLPYYLFIFLVTLFYGILFTYTDFHNNPYRDTSDLLVIFSQWFVVAFATYGLIYLSSINKLVFTIFFPIITFLSSILAYFKFTANISLTPMILDAALDNDIRTSLELITPTLIIFITFCFIISIFIVYLRFKIIKPTYKYIHLAFAFFILFITNFLFYSIRRPISERIPYTVFYTIGKYISEKAAISVQRKNLTEQAVCNKDSVTVVFVIGEALRPDHLYFNGYSRNTTPNLSQEKIISFPNIYSEYTYTNRSLPHILTRADSVHTERAFEESSFIGLFNVCNFESTWLANQESALTYTYFMNEAKNLQFANMSKSVYNYDKWLDGDLLPYFDKSLDNKKPRKLIVMHTIGSHWWYNAHFPDSFQQFTPVVKSKIISSCSKEEMVNSYDNTILYTDFFLKQVIDRLRNKNAILIFLSDHGEALGENNEWLHAHSNPALHNTACFIWMSPRYNAQHPLQWEAAQHNSKKRWRTDFLFHSILAAGEIQSPYRIDSLNIFSSNQ